MCGVIACSGDINNNDLKVTKTLKSPKLKDATCQ